MSQKVPSRPQHVVALFVPSVIVAVIVHREEEESVDENGDEVDFVAKEGSRIAQLIQVCWDMRRAGTRDREVRSLLRASKALDCDNLFVLTAATAGEDTVEWFGTRRVIRPKPLAEWAAI